MGEVLLVEKLKRLDGTTSEKKRGWQVREKYPD
jgi:hypothetical protein